VTAIKGSGPEVIASAAKLWHHMAFVIGCGQAPSWQWLQLLSSY